MILGELVDVMPGTNLSRVKGGPNDNKFLIYNQQAFLDDLNRIVENRVEFKSVFVSDPAKLLFVYPGDLIFNLTTQEAAIIQKRGIKDRVVLPNNYCKIVVISQDLQLAFLEFWFNKAPLALEQYQSLVTGTLKKLAVKHINNLKIVLPNKEIQEVSAEIWESQRQLSYLRSIEERIQTDKLVQKVFLVKETRS